MNKFEIGQRVYFMSLNKPRHGEIELLRVTCVYIVGLDMSRAYDQIFPTKAALLAHLTKQVEGLE